MQLLTELERVRRRVTAAFADVPRPDLRAIYPLGCCDDHEPDFLWYRHHTWQDLARALPTGQFDPFQFPSLHPVAYHYFVPGVLVATLDTLSGDAPGRILWAEDWIYTLVPMSSRVAGFKHAYLPKFGAHQRRAVGHHLTVLNHWQQSQRGYGDDDIDQAVLDVWWCTPDGS